VLYRAHTQCPVCPGPYENSVIWQKTEKYKEGKVVANHMFPVSSVEFFSPRTSRQGAILFKLLTEKCPAMLPRCHNSERGCPSRAGASGNEGDTGNKKRTKPGKPQQLANCHVNVATSPQHFTTDYVKTAAPSRLVLGNKYLRLETWFAKIFPSLYFSVLCQITEFSYGSELMGHTV
jgi:hypothetical protein